MAVLPFRLTTSCEGINLRIEPQGIHWVPQWSRLTTHWSDFRVAGKTLQFSSQGEALTFANILLTRWAESNKKSWQAVRTQVCQELVVAQ